METAALKNEVATVRAETDHIDFKSRFDPDAARDWCEIIKDIIAMHNSQGGAILFGLDSSGCDAGDATGLARPVDPADVINKVRKYTGQALHDFRVEDFERNGRTYRGWVIPAAEVPVPFKKPGTWKNADGRQDRSFSVGQVYFRHGAASEPANIEDMAAWKERVAASARQKMHEEMGKLVSVPGGHSVQIVPDGATVQVPSVADRVRVTDDPSAPGCVVVDRFTTHPHRQKELIARLVTRLPAFRVNQFDVLCVRRVYAAEIDAKGFVYMPAHSSAHYSDKFVDWIAGKIGDDPAFLDKTRGAYKQVRAA
jgi:hypothetical protein